MCGIAGYTSKKVDKNILIKMTDRISHRGPDGCGYHVDDNVALGHRRLSIIDLSTGSQPIYNEDKTKVIVFNGEIYNYQELKEELKKLGHYFTTMSDTEVILHGYEEWKCDVCNHLRGMFAFCIYDKNDKSLFLARDHFGIKPLYYYKGEDDFLFASEIKAFLDHPSFKKEFNDRILASYLCFNSTPTEETFFKGVYRLEPGHYLLYKDNKITKNRFFHLTFDIKNESLDVVTSNIEKSMADSVRYHEISDVEVGSFLSSGIDSSYLVSLAKPDKTYTVGYDNKKYDEISYAKDLTDKLGISNTSYKITKEEYLKAFPNIMYHMDEPLADPSAIALYFVSKIASKDVKVVLSGEGADELFGGYNNYIENMPWYNHVPYFIRHMVAKIVGLFPEIRGLNFLYRRGMKLEDYHIGLGRVFKDSEAKKIVKIKNQISTKEITKPYYTEYKKETDLTKKQVIDYYFWLVKDFLHAVDRNTMMFGLEARTPFLDKKVYEVARTLKDDNKVKNGQTKVALRNAASHVIPNEAYKKKKLGFPVPLREWMKEDDLYLEIQKKFLSETASIYFDQKKILKLLNDEKTGKKDCYKKVWTIYTFLVWYDVFFI